MRFLRWLLAAYVAAIVRASYVSASSFTAREGVAGGTCFTQPIDFGTTSFSYSMSIADTTQLASGCSASQILLSPILMSGTCLQQQWSYAAGCSSSINNGIVIGGTTAPSGQSISTSDTSGLCNSVFSQTSGSTTTLALANTSSYYFSSSVTCAPSTVGYFYIQNNCPEGTAQSNFTIKVDYTYAGYGCGYSHMNAWSAWGLWVFLGIAIFFVVFFVVLFLLRRRRQQAMAAQVQMMPMPPPPQAAMQPAVTATYYAPAPAVGVPVEEYHASGGGMSQPAVWYSGKPPA